MTRNGLKLRCDLQWRLETQERLESQYYILKLRKYLLLIHMQMFQNTRTLWKWKTSPTTDLKEPLDTSKKAEYKIMIISDVREEKVVKYKRRQQQQILQAPWNERFIKRWTTTTSPTYNTKYCAKHPHFDTFPRQNVRRFSGIVKRKSFGVRAGF